jgi:hypothetical protein
MEGEEVGEEEMEGVGEVEMEGVGEVERMDRSFHSMRAGRLNISELDPSLSLCFLCHTEQDFDNLCIGEHYPRPVNRIRHISDSGIQCCGSGMFIPDPDFYPSRIPDPKTATKQRGEKKNFCHTFYVAKNFTKLKNILVLKCRKKM